MKDNGHTIVFTIGEYTRGEVYTSDAQLQLLCRITGKGMFTTRPYAANKHTGTKFTIELHDRNYKKSISPEDRELIRNLGFAGLGDTHPAWNDPPTKNGICL